MIQKELRKRIVQNSRRYGRRRLSGRDVRAIFGFGCEYTYAVRKLDAETLEPKGKPTVRFTVMFMNPDDRSSVEETFEADSFLDGVREAIETMNKMRRAGMVLPKELGL